MLLSHPLSASVTRISMQTASYTVKGGEQCSTVHLLPCSIAYDGNAPVKDFFKVKKAGDKGNTKHTTDRAAFRGRALQG